MALAELIRELGQDIGLPDLDLDSDTGAVRLVFDDDFEVEFEEPGNGRVCFVYAVVGSLPVNAPGTLFFEFMQANLFGRETGGANLGYDAAREELMLFLRLHARDMNYPTFREEVENFLAALKKWRAALKHDAVSLSGEAGMTLSHAADPLSFVKV